MPELFEVVGLQEELQDVAKTLEYEAATRPGEESEIEALLISSKGRIQEAINLLEKIVEIMER